jgi:hypothetical protein
MQLRRCHDHDDHVGTFHDHTRVNGVSGVGHGSFPFVSGSSGIRFAGLEKLKIKKFFFLSKKIKYVSCVVMRNDITSAVANLTASERSLHDKASEDVREEMETLIIHVNDEVCRLQGLLGIVKEKVGDVMDDEPEKAPRKPPRKKKEEAGTPKWL